MPFDLTSIIDPNYPYSIKELGGTKARKDDSGERIPGVPGILGKDKYDWVRRKIVKNPRYNTSGGVFGDPNERGTYMSNIQIMGWVVIQVYKDRDLSKKK